MTLLCKRASGIGNLQYVKICDVGDTAGTFVGSRHRIKIAKNGCYHGSPEEGLDVAQARSCYPRGKAVSHGASQCAFFAGCIKVIFSRYRISLAIALCDLNITF
ncbi:hypothetical protein LFL96_06560 [Paraburkholderia sp. D15]|uniref:hypothetical protein n=1 Tax=Paraburkholderia sp. D15 TaxID=2880218 RepID=UPI00247885EF|nr:hypothetical protein [Paraburkholderia sp. D15]WGS51919.1 hypothetical protein LFL96_06560 [Paraburkholderia sp. D15]